MISHSLQKKESAVFNLSTDLPTLSTGWGELCPQISRVIHRKGRSLLRMCKINAFHVKREHTFLFLSTVLLIKLTRPEKKSAAAMQLVGHPTYFELLISGCFAPEESGI
ncbi:hypothetical protein [Anoxynatronum buryatiense]|uniref:hypothetical protein n=1 Tax=Anoxynatronum buryatiense TaxID=489973 RepID=UPI0024B70B12|nr:hypothetical protein [Anoxynatronum buryatiense]